MTMSASGGALWPVITELGLATALPTVVGPSYGALLARLAALCGATTELWGVDDGDTAPRARWRLLAQGSPDAARGPAPQAPAPSVSSAAALLRPIAAHDSCPQLALPLLVGGRLQGVLSLSAAPAGALLPWQGALEELAPLLALALHAFPPVGSTEETPAECLASFASSAHLGEQLDRELARARRTCRPCVLLLIGIDRFAALAAAVGAATCEQIAQALTILLREVSRDGDMVGRHGPDQQLIFLPDTDGQGAGMAAQRYLAQLYRRPIIVPGHEPFYLDASIGIALFPVDGATASALVESAATALGVAQRLGGRRSVAA